MIARVEALNYRSLRYVSQQVSPFQILVGPNGSGKSTFLDVIAFLGDLLRVGPYKAIMGDGNGVRQRAPDLQHLTWLREGQRFDLAIELTIPDRLAEGEQSKWERVYYEVAIARDVESKEIALAEEDLSLVARGTERYDIPSSAQIELFPRQGLARNFFPPWPPKSQLHVVKKVARSVNDYFRAEGSKWNTQFRLGPGRSALANLPEDESRFPVATWVRRLLVDGVRKVTLDVGAMRRPSPSGLPAPFLPDGSNLPWVAQSLKDKHARHFDDWVAHVRTAIPDLKSIDTVVRPEDNHRYLVVEYANGLKAPSWVVSDGTLRLLALTILAYIPDLEGIYLIEEPENGIHPRAIETVFQSLSSVYRAQVLCASHSPIALSLAKPAQLLCFAKTEEGATDVIRGDEHPRLKNWQGTVDLGTLFASGGARMSLELVALVPDKNIEQAIRGVLGRHESVGFRPMGIPRVVVHPNRDPGVFRNARELLSAFRGDAAHALVVLDRAWDGAPSADPRELEAQVENRLKPDWGDRAACVCIDPEVENWVWSDSPHVAPALGWDDYRLLRDWLRDRQLWPDDSPKPPDPKRAFDEALWKVKRPHSSAIFAGLAENVSLRKCTDAAFRRLCDLLRAWFPIPPAAPLDDGSTSARH